MQQRRRAVSLPHAAADRPTVEEGLRVFSIERPDLVGLVVVLRRKLGDRRAARASARRGDPAALPIDADQQLVAGNEFVARLGSEAFDIDLAPIVVERRTRSDAVQIADRRGIVERIDVLDNVGLDEQVAFVIRRLAGVADVEGVVVARVEGKDVRTRAAEAGIVDTVGADHHVDAVVGVDLPAERPRAAFAREGGIGLVSAAAYLVVQPVGARDTEVPVEPGVFAASLRLALREVPRTDAGLDQGAGRSAAGLEDDVDHAAHVRAAVDDRRRSTHDLDAFDIGSREFGDVGRAGTTAVDQDQHFALEVASLSFGCTTADVEQGLAHRPFAHEADSILGQQVGD